jgi:hypothetical protein
MVHRALCAGHTEVVDAPGVPGMNAFQRFAACVAAIPRRPAIRSGLIRALQGRYGCGRQAKRRFTHNAG